MFRLLYFALLILTTSAHLKNVCKNYIDYSFRWISPNCWYNPDVDTDMPKLVTQHHYNLETYYVTTKDGYILQLFRLPLNETLRKGVVYLQHPATASCTVWVDKGEDSLAYALHDDGYEVWLGNFRGSYYSRNHTTLNPNKNKVYWNFSYHEIAIYDIPEQIETIKKVSGVKKMTMIGHSMAGTSVAIYTALMPLHATENVNAFVMLAPAVYLKHMNSPLYRLLTPFSNMIYSFLNHIGYVEIIPRNRLIRQVSKLCYETPNMAVCMFLYSLAFGYAPKEVNYPFMPLVASQTPAGVSLKTINHYAQTVNNHGEFRYYDYGKKINRKVYNSTQPPNYPLENIKSTFYLLCGTKDSLATCEVCKKLNNFEACSSSGVCPKSYMHQNRSISCTISRDAETFYGLLKKSSGVFQSLQSIEGFNHVSFLYGKHINDFINKPILQLLKNLSF